MQPGLGGRGSMFGWVEVDEAYVGGVDVHGDDVGGFRVNRDDVGGVDVDGVGWGWSAVEVFLVLHTFVVAHGCVLKRFLKDR